MKHNRVVGLLVSVVLLSASLLVAGIVLAYLTEYEGRRVAIAAACVAVGAGAAVVAYLLVSRFCRNKRNTIVVISLLLILLLVPLLSTVWPGQVIYSRFGLTVYSLIPVPVFDITVGSHGGLWFRDKSHFVSMEEVQPLLSPDVEVIVIGIGWHSAVRVAPAIPDLEGYEVHILPTPAAFELFNRYVSEGRNVVLLAHSTC